MVKFLKLLLSCGMIVVASAQTHVASQLQKVVTLHLSMSGGVPISPLLYGINYDWNAVPGTQTETFAHVMHSVAHVHAVRYPGGWNAEKYNWSDNTETRWPHYSPVPGATPTELLPLFQNVTFITPSAIAIQNPARADEVAQLSAQLVKKFSSQVKIWEIGNEWFLQRGAKQHPDILQENLSRYAMLLNQVVPRMKKANPSIHIYVVAEWNSQADAARLRKLTRPKVWDQIDGIAIHPYCGTQDDASSCTLLQKRIEEIRSATGKQDIYASEWAVVRNHTKDNFGIHNASFTLTAIRNMAMAGVKIGAYWPPAREIPAMSFVSRDLSTPYATGIVFGWMSTAYEGIALPVEGDMNAAAAQDHKSITVFVPSAEQGPEQVRIDLTNLPVHGVTSGKVLFSAEPDDIQVSWQASEVVLPVKITQEADGKRYAEFILDPGTPGRGRAYEIAYVTLR